MTAGTGAGIDMGLPSIEKKKAPPKTM